MYVFKINKYMNHQKVDLNRTFHLLSNERFCSLGLGFKNIFNQIPELQYYKTPAKRDFTWRMRKSPEPMREEGFSPALTPRPPPFPLAIPLSSTASTTMEAHFARPGEMSCEDIIRIENLY